MKEFKILNYHQRLELFTTYWIVSKHYEYTTMLWKCGYFKLDTTTMAKIQMLITKIHIRLFRTTERSKFNEPSLYVLLYLSKIVLLPMYNAISYLIGHNYARSWPPWSFLKNVKSFGNLDCLAIWSIYFSYSSSEFRDLNIKLQSQFYRSWVI